jgi:hypothetical protein
LNGSTIVIDPINFVGNAISPIVSVNSNFNPGAIIIQNGGSLSVGANLTQSGSLTILNGQLILNSGTFLVGNSFIVEDGGQVSVLNGTLNITDSLTIINGGQFAQNDGLVNIDGTFSLIDGNSTLNSTYLKNAGTLNVYGDTYLKCVTGNFRPQFTNYTENSTFHKDIFWDGVGNGIGSPKFESFAGIIVVLGVIENKVNSTVNMFFKLAGSSFMRFKGSHWKTKSIADSILQAEGTTLVFRDTNVFINEGVFFSRGITIFWDKVFIQGNGSFQFFEFYIYGENLESIVLYHQSPSPLKISGDVLIWGNFITNSNSITLNGTDEQVITPSVNIDTTKFYNLQIENSSNGGVTITSFGNSLVNTNVILVNNHLQLTMGKLNIPANTNFKLLDNATASSGNLVSYVNGPISKIGNDPFIFPVGKNGKWRRIGISAPNSTTSEFKAEYFDVSANSISPVNSPLTSVSNLEHWKLEQKAGIDTLQVKLFWEDAAASAISNCGDLTIANKFNNSWNDIPSSTSGSCTLQGSGSIESNANVFNFGEFTFGFYNGVTTQNFSLCLGDHISVGGNTYNSTGIYFDHFLDVNGNDSILITNLLISDPVAQIIGDPYSIHSSNYSGESFEWRFCNGNTIPNETQNYYVPTSSGMYQLIQTEGACSDTSDCVYFTKIDTTICDGTSFQLGGTNYIYAQNIGHTFVAVNGLDSIVSVNLQVNAPNAGISHSGTTLTAISQGSNMQWVDCSSGAIPGATLYSYTPTQAGMYALVQTVGQCTDTSECVFYTITDTSICFGENYQIDTFSYSTTGTYTHLLQANYNLLDSFSVTNLNVINPNLTTTISGGTITSNSTSGIYQWINCYNFSSISNETNQSYTPTVNGSYAVEVNEDGCIDTSDCFVFANVGVESLESNAEIQVYPNPIGESFTINLNGKDAENFIIRNGLGQIIHEGILDSSSIKIETRDFSSGVYYLEIYDASEKQIFKLVKN